MHFISPNSPLGRWLAFLLDALFISVAWAICCLPIFTLGAATAALNRVAQNWMKDRSGCTLVDFFRAFRENFKGATKIWLILLPPLAIILFNAYATWIALAGTTVTGKWLILISAVLWMAVAIYAFALQATFENKALTTVMNAVRIALSHLPTTLILVVLFALSVAATLLLPYGAFAYAPFCVFLAARPIWNVFKKVIAMPEVTVEGLDEELENKGE